ncbi:PIG-L family deacetylase [Chitinivorax sp. PXF-14]|uniref:PIG-L deacetylase family protein n=1 Tax=Chitinivorax sp. PXF-14 TaxID=3230488 RepID=UPI00346686E9
MSAQANPYLKLVTQFAGLLGQAQPLFPQRVAPAPAVPASPDAPLCLICSPHPDDECIVGALPLRLKREAGYRVLNLAITLGSKLERRAGRRQELRHACDYLGFELAVCGDDGFGGVSLASRDADASAWQDKVAALAAVFTRHAPALLVFPHAADGSATHIGVHWLVRDALQASGHACLTAQTEFWHPLADPNLMLETSLADTADLIAALACHVGEVQRNPYHLRLPAWMADNVRRGAEMIAGSGSTAPDYAFATLYRIARWDGAAFGPALPPALLGAADALSGWLATASSGKPSPA